MKQVSRLKEVVDGRQTDGVGPGPPNHALTCTCRLHFKRTEGPVASTAFFAYPIVLCANSLIANDKNTHSKHYDRRRADRVVCSFHC